MQIRVIKGKLKVSMETKGETRKWFDNLDSVLITIRKLSQRELAWHE